MSPSQSGLHRETETPGDEAIDRVREFLRQRSRMHGIDPEVIHSVQSDPDGEPAELRTSDLCALLDALERARESGDWWMNVSGNTAKGWGRERDLYRRGTQLAGVFRAAQRLKDARPKTPGLTYTPNLDDALDAVIAAVEAVDLDAPADPPPAPPACRGDNPVSIWSSLHLPNGREARCCDIGDGDEYGAFNPRDHDIDLAVAYEQIRLAIYPLVQAKRASNATVLLTRTDAAALRDLLALALDGMAASAGEETKADG